jgi:hypothetical protein
MRPHVEPDPPGTHEAEKGLGEIELEGAVEIQLG